MDLEWIIVVDLISWLLLQSILVAVVVIDAYLVNLLLHWRNVMRWLHLSDLMENLSGWHFLLSHLHYLLDVSLLLSNCLFHCSALLDQSLSFVQVAP